MRPHFSSPRMASVLTTCDHRIRVRDKPDPYISVYTPPSPTLTGDLVHIRWKGLLPPPFVQSVIDIVS